MDSQCNRQDGHCASWGFSSRPTPRQLLILCLHRMVQSLAFSEELSSQKNKLLIPIPLRTTSRKRQRFPSTSIFQDRLLLVFFEPRIGGRQSNACTAGSSNASAGKARAWHGALGLQVATSNAHTDERIPRAAQLCASLCDRVRACAGVLTALASTRARNPNHCELWTAGGIRVTASAGSAGCAHSGSSPLPPPAAEPRPTPAAE